jgi:protoheme IX farnesyltransferase
MRVLAQRQPQFINYILVLKPRETILLAFIGICTALFASIGSMETGKLVMVSIALLVGSAGCNGLTNYLDREVDAKMARTSNRVLPRGLINPPEKALPLIIGLIVIGLALSWILNPICFVFGLIGVVASSVWRKTISCTFLGIVAGCIPLLIGWFAVNNAFDIRILLICLMVAFWIPVHVWNVMLSRKQEYYNAGLYFFPLKTSEKLIKAILLILTVLIYVTSLMLYIYGGLHLLYLVIMNIMGIALLISVILTLFKTDRDYSWKAYKMSSFPYLGIMFLAIVIDSLVF